MDMNKYQRVALSTAMYPKDQALPYLALGLAGEAAEVANKVKKIIRGDYNDLPVHIIEENLDAIAKELGDVLWYVAVLSDELGESLDDVAQSNINKLYARKMAGKIIGDGDDR